MKKYKKALICSLFSMMFCTSMFVGTTYAWFTDEASVPTNQIVAGNLDVEISAKNSEGNYVPVTGTAELFKADALWEPGHVEVVTLKVSNLGTLALKYKVGINIKEEVKGKNVAGEELQLSTYIRFAAFDGDPAALKEAGTDLSTRDNAIAAAEAASPVALSSGINKGDYVLYPTAKATVANPSEKIMTLVVYMPTSVENEANYRIFDPTTDQVPSIKLGINVSATQAPLEEDSFDDQYDSGATYNI